jgi:hypothetical protein
MTATKEAKNKQANNQGMIFQGMRVFNFYAKAQTYNHKVILSPPIIETNFASSKRRPKCVNAITHAEVIYNKEAYSFPHENLNFPETLGLIMPPKKIFWSLMCRL